jgi:pectate lyase
LHHNYFVALSDKGIRAHGGKLHAYNNLFVDVKEAGVECADSARCYVEKNAFNIDNPVRKFSFVDDEGVPVDTTLGFVTMLSNLNAGEDVQDSLGYRPDYEYSADEIDADFAWRVRNRGGTR